MAFIDADKENVLAYYDRCLALLKSGGLLLIDNTLWGGAVANLADRDPVTETLRALNSKVHADPRVEMVLVPIGDGLTLARRSGANLIAHAICHLEARDTGVRESRRFHGRNPRQRPFTQWVLGPPR